MIEEVELDVTILLAAVIQAKGGSFELPYDVLSGIDPDKIALAIDPNDDETGIVIKVVDASDVVYE